MPDYLHPRFDSGLRFDDPLVFFDGPPPGHPLWNQPLPTENIPLNLTHMEYWEFPLERAQKTLPVWLMYVPALKIGTAGTADLSALIDGFEPLVQARTAAQDAADAAFRDVQGSLLIMKILGTKVPKIIEGHLDENERLMKDVDDLYRVNPRTESSILKRARELFPVWERANTAMAAMTPTQPAIVRSVAGVAYTAVMLKGLVDDYADLIKVLETKESALDAARETLRAHDRTTDNLNKRWYKVVKEMHDPGDPVSDALAGIPTEPGTPGPDPIEIEAVAQGGEAGLQILVSYAPGGGDHATSKEVQWQVLGTDAGGTLANAAPLAAAGVNCGRAVDQTVKARTAGSERSEGGVDDCDRMAIVWGGLEQTGMQ